MRGVHLTKGCTPMIGHTPWGGSPHESALTVHVERTPPWADASHKRTHLNLRLDYPAIEKLSRSISRTGRSKVSIDVAMDMSDMARDLLLIWVSSLGRSASRNLSMCGSRPASSWPSVVEISDLMSNPESASSSYVPWPTQRPYKQDMNHTLYTYQLQKYSVRERKAMPSEAIEVRSGNDGRVIHPHHRQDKRHMLSDNTASEPSIPTKTYFQPLWLDQCTNILFIDIYGWKARSKYDRFCLDGSLFVLRFCLFVCLFVRLLLLYFVLVGLFRVKCKHQNNTREEFVRRRRSIE